MGCTTARETRAVICCCPSPTNAGICPGRGKAISSRCSTVKYPGEISGRANLLYELTRQFVPVPCNTDRDRICTPGGVIDLSPAPEPSEASYWDRRTAATPTEGPCPTWEWFLSDRFGDEDAIEAVERVLGWLLTGRNDLQLAVLFCGGSGSGKSVITNLIRSLAGGFAFALSSDALGRESRSHQGKWVAGEGCRICLVHELQDVRANWELVKSWISGEWAVRDRAAYSAIEASYVMQAKLVITANGMPDTEGHAKAVARRLLYVPMERPVAREDPALGAKLLAEGPQILHRLVAAVRRWYADGADQRALRIPESWTEGKQAAMAVSDPLHEWTVNNLVYSEHNGDHISTEAIWNRFKAYNPGCTLTSAISGVRCAEPCLPAPARSGSASRTNGWSPATGTSDGPRSDRRTR